MRAVSGTRWGANETSLLTIYKMLIRSILDYGAAAYDSASISQLRKLDKIQYSALKLCFGAMKSTSASALQVESGEAPLHLRRLEQQSKFSIKIKASVNHAANSVLQDHWTTHYGKFTDNSRPLAAKVDQFFQHMTLNIVQTTVGKFPPWHIVLPNVDQTLASQVKKKDAPHILNALACDKINQQYADHVHIYTDASKDSSGKVKIGCHIRLSSTSQEY